MITPLTYLSVHTAEGRGRLWTVIHREMPLCADGPRDRALTVAAEFAGRVKLPLWDGDKGNWDGYILADPWH